MFSNFFFTKTGQYYLAQLGTGKSLVFTRGQFGDGVLSASADQTEQKSLINRLGDMPISKQSVSANTVTTTVQFSNKVDGSILPAFSFMEVGLLAKLRNVDGTDDPNFPEALVCYSNAVTAERADYIPNVLTEFIMNFPCTVSNAQNVSAVINESLVYVTQEDLAAERQARIDGDIAVAHKNYAIGDKSEIPSNIKAGDICFIWHKYGSSPEPTPVTLSVTYLNMPVSETEPTDGEEYWGQIVSESKEGTVEVEGEHISGEMEVAEEASGDTVFFNKII